MGARVLRRRQRRDGNVFKNNIVFANRSAQGVANADIVFQLRTNPAGAIGETVIESNLIARRAHNDAALDVQNGGGVIGLAEAEKKFSSYVRSNILDVPTFAVANPKAPEDFELAPGSRGIDEGAPLTRTRGAGSGKTIPLQDAGYFTDGFSLIDGDRVRIGDAAPLTVVAVDYAAHTITVDSSTTWSDKAPVSLDFHGKAPDIGAREAKPSAPPSRRVPKPPTALTGTALH